MAAPKNTKNVAPKAVPKKTSTPPPPSSGGGSGGGGGGGVGSSTAPLGRGLGIAAPAPVPAMGGGVGKAPVSGGGGGGGGGGGVGPGIGGGGGAFAPGVNLGNPEDTDYLAGDAQYQAQLAALMKALQDSNTDFGAQQGRYETNFGEGLRGLGYTPEVQDDPATLINEGRQGAWNQEDLNTASGRAINNQTNDFASRGLLQSSLYAQSKDDLMRSLTDQLGGMQGARTSFLDDLARQKGAFQNDNTSQQQQAKAEALARRAAGLSL